MRILHILGITYPCGTSKHVLMLASAQRQQGHESTVLCPGSTWLSNELHAAAIPHLEGDLRIRPFLLNLSKYCRLLRSQKFDIIHAHMTRAAYCATLLGTLTHKPVAASVHTLTHDVIFRRILPHGNNRIVCVSDYVRNTLLQQQIPPDYLKTVFNGTDCLRYSANIESCADGEDGRNAVRAELDIAADAEIVGLFGHGGDPEGSDPKGYALLIRAAREIISERPRARFVFVGHVPHNIDRKLMALADSEGVQDFLRFTGCRNDVPRLMRAMDVIAMPSEMETFGIVLIEAMALGKAVVGARVGGIPEVIADGETGLLADRTPVALAAAILELLEDSARRDAMGRAGQARVRALFSAGAMTTNFESLYREMLSSREQAVSAALKHRPRGA